MGLLKRIASGSAKVGRASVKLGKASSEGLKRYDAYMTKVEKRSIEKNQMRLKNATLEAKIAKQKALKKAYMPREDWV